MSIDFRAEGKSATVLSSGTAFPEFREGTANILEGLKRIFPGEDPGFIRDLIENSGVEWRHFVQPALDIPTPRDFTDRNAAYRQKAPKLAAEAARQALERGGLEPGQIDVLIDVSCTGMMIPAMNVNLVSVLGLRKNVLRIPVTESGCAAGAMSLGLAARLAAGGLRVLLVSVELCSLTLVHEDQSRANLISAVIFGDGAAAVVVGPGHGKLNFLASGSHLFPDTESVMGFRVGSLGLQIFLDRSLPVILERGLKPVVEEFLDHHDSSPDRLGRHLVHPGGRRILDSYAEMFGLGPGALDPSRESLRRFGNLSSASVLTVLDLALQNGLTSNGKSEILLIAFGPGLCAEMNLLSVNGKQ